MSLAFLAKKSWHTTNLKNVERVWMAEQKGEEEKKKVIELQKQIAEERQIQELRQLQVASGHVIKVVDNTLDWMYEGPAAEKIQQQSTEEYLLGKTYKAKEESSSDLKKVGNNTSGATWLNKTSSKNDMFTRLHEDPMLLIKQNEKRNLENVLKNPLKMEKIRIAVAAQMNDNERALKDAKKTARKDAKREKKDAKKEKKESKDKKRLRSTSSSRSPSKDNQDDSLKLDRRNFHEDHKIDGDTDFCDRVGRDGLGNKYNDRAKNLQRRNDFNSDGNDRRQDYNGHEKDNGRGRDGEQRRDDDRRRDRSRDDRGNSRGRDGEQRRDDDMRRDHSRDDRGNSRGRDGEQRRDDDMRRGRSRDDRRNSRGRDGEQRRDDDMRRERSRDGRGNGRGGDGERSRDRERKNESIKDGKSSSYGERKSQSSRVRSRSRDRYGSIESVFKSRETSGVVGEDRREKVKTEPSNAEKSRNADTDTVNEEVRAKSTDMGGNRKYGLQGRDGQIDSATSNKVSGEHLGPSLSLLAKRVEQENLNKASKNKPRENVKIISDAERKERIRQMEEDASTNSDMRLRRIQSSQSNKEDEKVELKAEASFLNSLRTEVYITNETSMTDRLQQNKYYMQKGTDLDSSGFMKK